VTREERSIDPFVVNLVPDFAREKQPNADKVDVLASLVRCAVLGGAIALSTARPSSRDVCMDGEAFEHDFDRLRWGASINRSADCPRRRVSANARLPE